MNAYNDNADDVIDQLIILMINIKKKITCMERFPIDRSFSPLFSLLMFSLTLCGKQSRNCHQHLKDEETEVPKREWDFPQGHLAH